MLKYAFLVLVFCSQAASADILSIAEIQEQVPRIVREVERQAGRNFINSPKLKLMEQYDPQAARELAPYYLDPNIDPEKIQTALQKITHQLDLSFQGKTMAGVYHDANQTSYIMIYNMVRRCSEMNNSDEKCNEKIIRNIAHELTHALQFQEAPWLHEYVGRYSRNMRSVCTVVGTKECDVALAVIEGHAMYIEQKVGEALAHKHMSVRSDFAKGLKQLEMKLSKDEFEELKYGMENIYMAGLSFMTEFSNRYGAHEAFSLFKDFPMPQEFSDMVTAADTSNCNSLF